MVWAGASACFEPRCGQDGGIVDSPLNEWCRGRAKRREPMMGMEMEMESPPPSPLNRREELQGVAEGASARAAAESA